MAAQSGKIQKLYLVTGSTVNTALVGELSSQWTINGNIIDVSDKDSSWFEGIMGNKSGEASASLTYQKGTNQNTILDALFAGTEVKIFIGEVTTGAQADGIMADALIASVGQSNPDNDKITWDVSFTFVGEITRVKTTTTTTTTVG